MVQINPSIAQQLAQAALKLQQERTGHAPASVTVVLGEDTLVIMLYGALTKAEKLLAQSAQGITQVQEFHRQLFADSSGPLRQEITKITGVEVREAAGEIEVGSGTVAQTFNNGTMVHVFLLKEKVPADIWTQSRSKDASSSSTVN